MNAPASLEVPMPSTNQQVNFRLSPDEARLSSEVTEKLGKSPARLAKEAYLLMLGAPLEDVQEHGDVMVMEKPREVPIPAKPSPIGKVVTLPPKPKTMGVGRRMGVQFCTCNVPMLGEDGSCQRCGRLTES